MMRHFFAKKTKVCSLFLIACLSFEVLRLMGAEFDLSPADAAGATASTAETRNFLIQLSIRLG